MSREPVVVSESSAGAPLAGVIEVYLALDEARQERSRRVHLMALLSVPLAGLLCWPALFSETGRRAVLTFWSFSALAAGWALVVEWRLGRRALSLSAGTPRPVQ
jgi:hypothetical protein